LTIGKHYNKVFCGKTVYKNVIVQRADISGLGFIAIIYDNPTWVGSSIPEVNYCGNEFRTRSMTLISIKEIEGMI
jgi:hypothetical protein